MNKTMIYVVGWKLKNKPDIKEFSIEVDKKAPTKRKLEIAETKLRSIIGSSQANIIFFESVIR